MNINYPPQLLKLVNHDNLKEPKLLMVKSAVWRYFRFKYLPVLEFTEIEEWLVLWDDNLKVISEEWGDETDYWLESQILVSPDAAITVTLPDEE